jgi:hypothetical protein
VVRWRDTVGCGHAAQFGEVGEGGWGELGGRGLAGGEGVEAGAGPALEWLEWGVVEVGGCGEIQAEALDVGSAHPTKGGGEEVEWRHVEGAGQFDQAEDAD